MGVGGGGGGGVVVVLIFEFKIQFYRVYFFVGHVIESCLVETVFIIIIFLTEPLNV